MAKIVYSEIKDCLDCPFVRIKSKHGDANCWHYDKSVMTQAEEKPRFCKVESITVKEKT